MRDYPLRTARRLLVAMAAVAVLAGCGGAGSEEPPPGTAPPSSTPAPTTQPSEHPTTPPATPSEQPTNPPVVTEPPAPSPDLLRPGSRGPAVRALQERLAGLGYWLGEPDGTYGDGTVHAVVAFQKATGLAPDGVAGPRTLQALESASRLNPRSGQGRVIEVDLKRQLLLVAVDGRVEQVFNTSTGAVPGTTPPGQYQVFREVDGYDPGPLGTLYRPKYFYQGVAVHGYPSVPPYPASHGCVRVTNAAMDWLWRTGNMPIGQIIWVY